MEPGEPVVVEDFVYAGTLAIMDPYQPHYMIVPGDNKGMRPDALREVLSSGPRPKFLYINPTGANPTGKLILVYTYVSSGFFLPPGVPNLGVKFFYPPALPRCPGPPRFCPPH